MKSILGLYGAVALGLCAGIAMLCWWAPTIVLLRARLALASAGDAYRGGRARRLLRCGDQAEADRVLARLRREAETARDDPRARPSRWVAPS